MALDEQTRKQIFVAAFSAMTKLQLEIFALRYGLRDRVPLRPTVIAQRLGLSEVEVSAYLLGAELRYLHAGRIQGSEEYERRLAQLGQRHLNDSYIAIYLSQGEARSFDEAPLAIEAVQLQTAFPIEALF